MSMRSAILFSSGRVTHLSQRCAESLAIDHLAFWRVLRHVKFCDVEKDATNKCLALKVEMVYPNGAKQGNI
ncbi:MAG: hypothetical protein LBQ90_01310 [Synergistaceae bacterium]|jgi:hypothetical protein|nr:hypothetical protein [Synergistaceae bacterium]